MNRFLFYQGRFTTLIFSFVEIVKSCPRPLKGLHRWWRPFFVHVRILQPFRFCWIGSFSIKAITKIHNIYTFIAHSWQFNIGASKTVSTSQISIFDRWGKIIYKGPESDDRLIESGWDGTSDGSPVKSGVYVYTAVVKYVDGKEDFFKGDVTVIR